MTKKLIKTNDAQNRHLIEKYLHDNNIMFSKYASSDNEFYYFVTTTKELSIDGVEYEIIPVKTNMNLEVAADEDNPMRQPEPDRFEDLEEELKSNLPYFLIVAFLFAASVAMWVF